jgi:hypothetical protein
MVAALFNIQHPASNIQNRSFYQLDLITPGSLPSDAKLRKQMRQIPNFLKNARGRPQIGQRLYCLTLNFGFFTAFN